MDGRSRQPHRSAAALLLVAGVGLAFYVTLFPFDFLAREPFTFQLILARFDADFSAGYVVDDIPRNVALFVPIGFGLVGLLPSRLSPAVRLGTALLAGAVISTSVEIGQLFLDGRFATPADLLANAIGALAGGRL